MIRSNNGTISVTEIEEKLLEQGSRFRLLMRLKESRLFCKEQGPGSGPGEHLGKEGDWLKGAPGA